MSLAELVANIRRANCREDELSNALSQRKVQYRLFPVTLRSHESFFGGREKQTPGFTRVIRVVQSCGRSRHDQSSPCYVPGSRYSNVERLLDA